MTPELFETFRATLRQYAQEFISGARVERAGPAYGHAILGLLETIEDHEHRVEELAACQAAHAEAIAALMEGKADREELQAAYDLIETQRDTIEALLAENDALRAKLYLYERKAQEAP